MSSVLSQKNKNYGHMDINLFNCSMTSLAPLSSRVGCLSFQHFRTTVTLTNFYKRGIYDDASKGEHIMQTTQFLSVSLTIIFIRIKKGQ